MSEPAEQRYIIDKTVFYPALILLFGAIFLLLLVPEKGSDPFAGLQALIVDTASWFYVFIAGLVSVVVMGGVEQQDLVWNHTQLTQLQSLNLGSWESLYYKIFVSFFTFCDFCFQNFQNYVVWHVAVLVE